MNRVTRSVLEVINSEGWKHLVRAEMEMPIVHGPYEDPPTEEEATEALKEWVRDYAFGHMKFRKAFLEAMLDEVEWHELADTFYHEKVWPDEG